MPAVLTLILTPIVYRIRGDRVQFLYVDHHNFVYEKATEILEKIEQE
jgi:hypothetical protein